MAKVTIFDYGVGNLLSIKTALEKVGLEASIGTSIKELADADAIALPGVGAFSAAASKLEEIKETLLNKVEAGTPLLGVCLGLQLFFQESEEGSGDGLALFRGKTIRLPNTVKVPHMGWNTLNFVKQNELFDGIAENSYVYFVHSLYPVPVDKSIVCTQTDYGATFASSIAERNIYGMQFHPEKSGDIGLRILKNFAKTVVR